MRIKSFEFKDLKTGWELEKLEFQRLNLLVGASGVGKSMILRNLLSVLDYKNVSEKNPAEWNIEIDSEETSYQWSGKTNSGIAGTAFKNFSKYDLLRHKEPSTFANELISINGSAIAKRVEIDYMKHEIYYSNNKIPNLNKLQSLLETISEKEMDDFRKTLEEYVNLSNARMGIFSLLALPLDNPYAREDIVPNYSSWQGDIFKFNEEVDIRTLYYLQNSNDSRFFDIAQDFLDIFPNIHNIEIKAFAEPHYTEYVLFITEEGVDHPIPAEDISQGMRTTLAHIITLHLAPENSVILVDEFENSLGVNCLDAVVDLINNNERNIQFILTSHHPYIINNIPMKNWKVVLREGAKVRAVDAEELGLGKSKHEAFNQLIATDAFRFGKL